VKPDPHNWLFAAIEKLACHVAGVSNVAPCERVGAAHWSNYAEPSILGEFRSRPLRSVTVCVLRAIALTHASQRLPRNVFDADRVMGNRCWAETLHGAVEALGWTQAGDGSGQAPDGWLDDVVAASIAIMNDPAAQKLLNAAEGALVSAVERPSPRDVKGFGRLRPVTFSDVMLEVQKAMETAVSIAELQRLRQVVCAAESRVTARSMARRFGAVSARACRQLVMTTRMSAPRLRLVQA